MKVQANAKLNLSLSVVGNCGGFHMIESSVATVDICDTIEVTERSDKQITVAGTPTIDLHQNIAYRAAVAIVEAFDTAGVDITIDKGIPLMSGMGGSSADGAGVIVAMCRLFALSTTDKRILDIASSIGSDVTYLISGGCAVISGKGDNVQQLPYTVRHFVVTTFDTKLNTREVFALYDSSPKVDCSNALQGAVEQHYNYMANYKQYAIELGLQCHMTGSGSAYFMQCSSRQLACDIASQLNARGFVSSPCSSTARGVDVV